MLVYSTLFLSLRRPSFLNPLNVLYYHCHFKFLPRTHLHSTQYIVCYGRKYFAVFTIYPGTQIVQHCGLTLLYHKGPDKCLVQSHKTIVYFTENHRIRTRVKFLPKVTALSSQTLHLVVTLWCRHCGRKLVLRWQTLPLTRFRHSRRPGQPLQIRQSRQNCSQRYAKRLKSSQHRYQYCRKP